MQSACTHSKGGEELEGQRLLLLVVRRRSSRSSPVARTKRDNEELEGWDWMRPWACSDLKAAVALSSGCASNSATSSAASWLRQRATTAASRRGFGVKPSMPRLFVGGQPLAQTTLRERALAQEGHLMFPPCFLAQQRPKLFAVEVGVHQLCDQA